MSNLRVINGGDPPEEAGIAEYVWTDSKGQFHSRIRPVEVYKGTPRIEHWTALFPFTDKEVLLRPAQIVEDCFREAPAYVVLCEVKDLQDMPHESNHRAAFRQFLSGGKANPHIEPCTHGAPCTRVYCEQGEGDVHLPASLTYEFRYRRAQGARGYTTAEEHLNACVKAGLHLQSTAFYEQLPEWGFRVGPRGFQLDEQDPLKHMLTTCDHYLLTRYFLERAARENGTQIQALPGTILARHTEIKPHTVVRGLQHYWNLRVTPEGIQVKMPEPLYDPYRQARRLLTNIRALTTK